jgi:acetyl-CoA carboxylase biotin carboxylase subunit
MDRALGEFRVEGQGLRTTIGFLREILAHPAHRAGKHTTGFVGTMTADRQGSAMVVDRQGSAMAAAAEG